MRNMLTNFALLMELTRARPEEVYRATGAHPSLISRWCTGGRSPNRRWRQIQAEYFLGRHKESTEALLAEVAPLGLAQGMPPVRLLEDWIAKTDGSWERREELLFLSRCRLERRKGKGRLRQLLGMGTLSGCEAVRELIVEFLDYALAQPGAGEIFFACPDGLELFTRDESYNLPLQKKLFKVLEHGKRLQVVLRTNYRPSDVAAACGPWLWAHLMGYIQSYYYDDFRLLEHEKILIGLRGRLMIQVRAASNGPRAVIHSDPQMIAHIENLFDCCMKQSQQRFHYDFFTHPRGFLYGASYCNQKNMYMIEDLPDLGTGWETISRLVELKPHEKTLLERQFWPLFLSPWDFGAAAGVYHILCTESIDEALDGVRHLCRPLSAICKRRVYLTAQMLVTQLTETRKALELRPGYHVCFIPREDFCRLGMEIGVWGNEIAIAWTPTGQSTACRDYPNVAALHGFCATLWEKIPRTYLTRQSAKRRLDRWLERAGKLGFRIEP